MKKYIEAIGFNKYKSLSFDDKTFYIDMNKNISLIIGRNNSGKSSLIDVVETACSKSPDKNVIGLHYVYELDKQHIETGFRNNTWGDGIPRNHHDYGMNLVGKDISFIYSNNKYDLAEKKNQFFDTDIGKNCLLTVARNYSHISSKYVVRRVNADRDVYPESESLSNSIEPNGSGATNIIRRFINSVQYDEKIVEQTILRELNSIIGPDAKFTQIRIQQLDSIESLNREDEQKWEIFIEEDGKRFALSKSGSGLKTLILILINLYICPHLPEYQNKEIIYAFEELENNLHPALQRRLFEYLYDYSIKGKRRIFLTTHSNVAINTFFSKDGVSIYHVTKTNGISSIKRIETDKSKLEILDDLDVRASDIFQANGIVWVEGPSDRIYINKWLEVFCENDIKEGMDYQFAYYGGKLLSGYTSLEDISNTDNLINILKTNRHAAVVIDSDRKEKHARINNTKRRIRDEFKSIGSFCWITEGKEIENYLSVDAVNKVHSTNLKQIDQYALFPQYIRKYDKNFSNHKVEAARNYSQYITLENSANILDLKEKIQQLYETIKKWN